MDEQKTERQRMGHRLRMARERARIPVEEAAQAANVQPLAILRWEKGVTLPALPELRRLLPLYGVMACEILFDSNPWELTEEQSAELVRAAKGFSPGLRSRVDLMLAMIGKGREPVWKKQAAG